MQFTGSIDTGTLIEALWDEIGPAVESQVGELVEGQVDTRAEDFVEGYLDGNLNGLVTVKVQDYLRYNLGDAVSEALADEPDLDPDDADFEAAVLEVVRRHVAPSEVSYETDEFKDAVLKVVTDPEVIVVLTLLIAHGTKTMAKDILDRMDASAAAKVEASTAVDDEDTEPPFETGYGLGQDD